MADLEEGGGALLLADGTGTRTREDKNRHTGLFGYLLSK